MLQLDAQMPGLAMSELQGDAALTGCQKVMMQLRRGVAPEILTESP